MKNLIFLIPITIMLFACASLSEDESQNPVATPSKLVSQSEHLNAELTSTSTQIPTVAPTFTPVPTWPPTPPPAYTPIPTENSVSTPISTLIPVLSSPTPSPEPKSSIVLVTPTSWAILSPTQTPTVTPNTDQKRLVAPELSPSITPTPQFDLHDFVSCSISGDFLQVLCTAPKELFGEWSSNATTRSQGGSTFEFEIEVDVPEIVVEWNVCVPSGCRVVTVYLEGPTVALETRELTGIEGQNQVTEEAQEVFWNERSSTLPECETEFRFSHKLVTPDDVAQLMFGPGSHIEPHEHMVYWGLWGAGGRAAEEDLANPDIQASPIPEVTLGEKIQVSERVQLYAPTDIYRIDVGYANRSTEKGETYIEWGGYIYACNGHQLMLGHIGEPSDEVLAILAQSEPKCDMVMGYAAKTETGCGWVIDTYIPAGTPIFKSSGYAGAFDFGLSLFGLTADELQEQPGYGYSITPWRVSSGRAVCPLGYFLEPLRSDYLRLLRDNMTEQLLECGPFNQDVPNTAMGFWLPSPSTEIAPLLQSDRSVDEWDTVWLFESNNDPSVHVLSVGNNTFGLDYGQYNIPTVSDGLVNRRWDFIQPTQTYCSELEEAWADSAELRIDKILTISLSSDGNALTLEAITGGPCGDPPWIFGGNERTFYR